MTTENQPVEEVEPVETQEVEAVETEAPENPPEGEVTEQSESEKQKARDKFWERQNKYKEEAAEAEKLRRENEYLRKMAEQQQAPARPVQQPVTGEPLLENFDSESEWLNAVLDHRETKKAQAEKLNNMTKSYGQKLEEYKKVSKDIYAYENEVVRLIGNRPDIAQAIIRSDKAAQIVEAIALDTSKIESLHRSRDPYELASSLISLEQSLNVKPSYSDAPPPKSNPKGEAPQSGHQDVSKMTPAEYRQFRNQQRRR